MTTNYNVTGSDRKRLVSVIAESTGEKPKYQGMPSMAYEIGPFTVTKDGTLEFSDRTDSEVVEKLYEDIAAAGFDFESVDAPEEPAADEPADADGLVIGMPLAGFDPDSLDRLRKLTDSKATLIKKALDADCLTIRVNEGRVEFPWFTHLPAPETVNAATHLIAAMCRHAKECVRVTATEHEVESEKYAFRVFLLRLGFGGQEYKAVRAELMKNLSGHAAFPTAEAAEKFKADQKAKRAASRQVRLPGAEALEAAIAEMEKEAFAQ